MYCKNCGMKMHKNFCTHCGLMDNGIFIDTKKPIKYKNTEYYLGKDFDKITRNENWFIAGLLGPTYIICRGFILEGLLLMVIDTLITIFFMLFNNVALILSIVWLIDCIYIFINRVVWATIANLIYLNLLERKCIKLKKKHPNDYKDICRKKYNRDLFIIGTRYILLGLITAIFVRSLLIVILNYLSFNFPL